MATLNYVIVTMQVYCIHDAYIIICGYISNTFAGDLPNKIEVHLMIFTYLYGLS